jgi:hypothetical protein
VTEIFSEPRRVPLAQLRGGYRDVEAYRFGPGGDPPRIFVGFVHRPKVHWTFAASLMKLLQALRWRVTVLGIPSGPNISGPRNDVAAAFLQTDDDWLLWVDTDIAFEPDQVGQLLEHDLDIVGGCYLNVFGTGQQGTGDGPPIPVASVQTGPGKFKRGDVLPQTGLHKVSGLGMGFTLVRRVVFEKLTTGPLWPFAELAVTGEDIGAVDEVDKRTIHMLSEDITFCFRAQAAGFEVYLDMDCKVRHHKSTVY